MAKKPAEEGLADHLDAFFLQLMNEAYPEPTEAAPDDEGPTVGFVDRVRLFDSGVRWIMVKNKVSPEEEEDAFAAARKRTIGRARKRRAPGPSPASNGHA
jgi:hypothetical protein